MNSNLSRFIDAQKDLYESALSELRAGRKRGHWMWFVFPQLCGLGVSQTSKYYGIADLAEAKAYIGDPILGRRLVDCTNAVMNTTGSSVHDIFGAPDDLKFVSSMTLFSSVQEAPDLFQQALSRFNGGNFDSATLGLLSRLESDSPTKRALGSKTRGS